MSAGWWLTAFAVAIAATISAALAAGSLRKRWLIVTVEGASMEPTYVDGDRLLVRRAGAKAIRRDAVVVLRRERAAGTDLDIMIKRVRALPGDRVPDGMPMPEEFVPPGCLVVLGDNAAASYDSRRAGYLPWHAVIGVVRRPIGASRRF